MPEDFHINNEISFNSSDISEPAFAATVPDHVNHVGKLPVKHVAKAAWQADSRKTDNVSKWSDLSISQSEGN